MRTSLETTVNRTMHILQKCAHCSAEAKCRRREFSEQAWSALLVWEEISFNTVDNPLCESCYDEMREILIDRSDELNRTEFKSVAELQLEHKAYGEKKAVNAGSTAAKKKKPAVKAKAKKTRRVA